MEANQVPRTTARIFVLSPPREAADRLVLANFWGAGTVLMGTHDHGVFMIGIGWQEVEIPGPIHPFAYATFTRDRALEHAPPATPS